MEQSSRPPGHTQGIVREGGAVLALMMSALKIERQDRTSSPRTKADLELHLPPLEAGQARPSPQGQLSPEEGGWRVGAVPGTGPGWQEWAGTCWALPACVPGSLAHHLVFSHFVITSPSPSPPKVSLMNWSLRLSRELKPRVLRVGHVPLGGPGQT